MKALTLQFTAPYHVALHEETAKDPGTNQVRLRTIVSGISPGTELLVYRGEWPRNLPVDATIPNLAGEFAYPLTYGYAAVAAVEAVGQGVSESLLGRRVFAFNPHQSHFLVRSDQLILLPDSLSTDAAAFLPNMETAVSLVMDGRPLIGERVVVIGQGVVGLLTTGLLGRIPLERLVTLDRFLIRRKKSRELGAHVTYDPADGSVIAWARPLPEGPDSDNGADLVYELSGNPAGLDLAITAAGFSGRVVVGSWYGTKRADLDLGGRFHRGRLQLMSSQVSRLAPELTGRWTKARRLRWALRMLEEHNPVDLITHRFHISRCAEAYALLHEAPGRTIQVLFTYED